MSLDDWAREGSRTSRRPAGVESPIPIQEPVAEEGHRASCKFHKSLTRIQAQMGHTTRPATPSSVSLTHVRMIIAGVHPASAFSDIGRPV